MRIGAGVGCAVNLAKSHRRKSALVRKTTAVRGLDDYGFEGPVAPSAPDALTKLEGKFSEKQISSVDLFSNLAAAATLEALTDAGLLDDTERLEQAAIIMKKAPEGTEFELDSKLIDIGLDSLDVVEIVFEIEDKYPIQLPQNDQDTGSATFKDLCELVEKHVATKAAEDKSAQPAK